MANVEWSANDYAIGAYLQATISDRYLERLTTNIDDDVLDIGCGDGSYTTKILERIPKGTLLGIDRSANMLALAREKINDYPNFSVQQADVLTMDFKEQFDYVVSYWCLQWCSNPFQAYTNIYHALKKGGKLLTILPTGQDPFIRSFNFVKATGEFPCLRDFKPPIDYSKFDDLLAVIAKIPFKNAKVDVFTHSVPLPSLDIFRKFVNGLPFFKEQVPDEQIPHINEALVKAFELECKKNYHGKYQFNASIYVVTAEK